MGWPQPNKLVRYQPVLLVISALLGMITAVFTLIYFIQKRRKASLDVTHPHITGLSSTEAQSRHIPVDLEKLVKQEERHFLRQAIRRSLLTTFNIDLFGIAIIMLILGSPLSTLGTMLILLINVIINVFQQVYTKRQLDELMQKVRPNASVIRDGRLHIVAPIELVVGDMVAVNTGDQILANGVLVDDGEITVDEAISTDNYQRQKRKGDHVQAGTVCLNGRSIYEVTDIDSEYLTAISTSGVQILPTEYTPLQRIIENVLHGLFLLALFFSILLVADAIWQEIEVVSAAYRDGFSIIFGIAPTSLFLILIVHYAVGSLRLADFGALVYRSQAIESLASVSVLCLSRRTLLGGIQLNIEPRKQSDNEEFFSERKLRQLLGELFHSAPVYSPVEQILLESLPGDARNPVEALPYHAVYGWSGVSFDDDDLHGTFIWGETSVLEPFLVVENTDLLAEMDKGLQEANRGIRSWLRRRFSNSEDKNVQQVASIENPKREIEKRPLWGRFRQQLHTLIEPLEEERELIQPDEEPSTEQITMLFAYQPEIKSLVNEVGEPQIPSQLIPLAFVRVSAAIGTEARETIQTIKQAGIDIKLMAISDTNKAAATGKVLGLVEDTVSGAELDNLSEQEFDEMVRKVSVFSKLTPEQKANIVQSLRRQGETVAMVGDSASDILAMHAANLRITLQNGTQATLLTTDIALLQNSLVSLPAIFKTGQRLVNGVLDTFKLYLSQVTSQLLLIIALLLFSFEEFPYHPTQAGVISIFTITIPNIMLIFWSSSGQMSQAKMRQRLAHFVVPSAITLAFLTMTVNVLFYKESQIVTYAQLAVTYALLGAGWLRVLFLRPPAKFWTGGEELAGDKRVYWLLLGTVLTFLIVQLVPILRELLWIEYLPSIADYIQVILAVAAWAIILRIIWRRDLFIRLVETIANRFHI